MRHLHVWGCQTEPYKPNERRLDSRTVSCYFVGYPERSRSFNFYDPSTRSFFKTRNAKFIEDVEYDVGNAIRNFFFEEEYITIPSVAPYNEQTITPVIIEDADPDVQDIILELPPTIIKNQILFRRRYNNLRR